MLDERSEAILIIKAEGELTNKRTNKGTNKHKIFGISATERSEVTYISTIYDGSEDNIN